MTPARRDPPDGYQLLKSGTALPVGERFEMNCDAVCAATGVAMEFSRRVLINEVEVLTLADIVNRGIAQIQSEQRFDVFVVTGCNLPYDRDSSEAIFMAGHLRLIEHNLALHKLSHMRDRECAPNRFRRLMRQASLILCSEMTRDLDLTPKEIVTANGVRTTAYVRDQSDLVIMPVLRAGLVMGDAFSELLPLARTGHIGIYRSPQNQHHCYMLSIPRTPSSTKFLLVDPVISHGETAALAVRSLREKGIKGENIRFGCLIISEDGRKNFYDNPANKGITGDVDIFAIAEDPKLDDNLYVLPGLGNASDRLFRTNESYDETQEFE